MNLISAIDIARRDQAPSVQDWIRATAIEMQKRGAAPMMWDGDVSGAPVYAFVSNGRWLALCDQPHCDGCEYVDVNSHIFFCMRCSNGTGKARLVIFPERWEEIEHALLERPMMPVSGINVVEQTFNARPLYPFLRRDWVPAELEDHPFLLRRVTVSVFGASPEVLRIENQEVLHVGNA